MKKEVEGEFRFDQDSKRFHRFNIEAEGGVVGMLYVPKKPKQLPDTIILKRGENL